jgi:GTPase-associated protein 1, N-terminal domain type 1
LNAGSRESIDQALFGYADGHRQIASSVRLPPKDLFILSSASDLASGARLGERESYLSGLPLPDSRRYAFFRTWAAPEMPRPGCVWSHVLLLGPKTSASIPALSEVLPFFRRPVANETSSYGQPLDISTSLLVEPGPVDLISEIIAGYYTNGRAVLSPDSGDPDAIENAVLTVWSQQWPRLRLSFSFCTASLSENRRTDESAYSVQVAPLGETTSISRERWVSFAAADAAQNRVTPLRRFLWRYGRDIGSGWHAYRVLIELFTAAEGHSHLPTEDALRVFAELPDPADAEILKKDILGVATSSPSLSPAVSPVGLLDLLADGHVANLMPSNVLIERFRNLDPTAVGPIARRLDHYYDNLAPWRIQIEDAIASGADEKTLIPDFPPRLRMIILRTRPDLISKSSLQPLADREVEELFERHSSGPAAEVLAREVVTRDFGYDTNNKLLSTASGRLFSATLDALPGGELNSAWKPLWRSQAPAIFRDGWPSAKEGTWSRVAAGIARLGYPRRIGPGANDWYDHLRALTDDLTGSDRIRFQGFLLRAALDENSTGTWTLCTIVLPELRPVILQGALPDDVYQMLARDVPHYNTAAYWDINRRILICLSYLRQTVRDETSEKALSLSDYDRDILAHGAEEEEESKRRRFWLF